MDSTGSATISNRDILQPDWSVDVGQTLVSQCPEGSVDGHGEVSRFDEGLTVRSSKCVAVATLHSRMTPRLIDCEGEWIIRPCKAYYSVRHRDSTRI